MFVLISTYDTNSAARSRAFRLAHPGALPLGHILLGLLEGAFKLRRKFQFVFDVVIKPVAILLQLTTEITGKERTTTFYFPTFVASVCFVVKSWDVTAGSPFLPTQGATA